MPTSRRSLLVLWLCLLPILAPAQQRLDLAGPDKAALLAEDTAASLVDAPERFAWPADLTLVPGPDEGWDRLPDGRHRWRLLVAAPGSLSLNFGFGRFRLPEGGSLSIGGREGPERRFTAADNRPDGQLWTPVVLGDEALLTLLLPAAARADFSLELSRVGRGYRGFGAHGGDKAPGWCNIDVVCPQGDSWRDQIRSVGVYTLGGYWRCTGVMINNTAQDGTPYFLTANHCGVSTGNAASLVVYWNFESPVCGDLAGGSLDDVQTGAVWRAAHGDSDMSLVELSSLPDPEWLVTYAGWDRSGATPDSAITIHHPSTDEKCISFETDPPTITSYLAAAVPGDRTHWRIVDWDLGTTEPGSSGAPLFDPAGRIIGQLHGGYAACGNDLSDWYGRLSVSWTGGGAPTSQLAAWLDPLATGASTLDLYDPAGPQTLVLDDLVVTPAANEALLSWTTAEPAGHRVAYGLTRRLELGAVVDQTLATAHEALLPGLEPATVYHYRIEVTTGGGETTRSLVATFRTGDPLPQQPTALLPAAPNPSRAAVTLSYRLARAGRVRLGVYDLRGRLVALLVDEDRTAGGHAVVWEGARAPAGLYVARLEAPGGGGAVGVVRLR